MTRSPPGEKGVTIKVRAVTKRILRVRGPLLMPRFLTKRVTKWGRAEFGTNFSIGGGAVRKGILRVRGPLFVTGLVTNV